MKKSFHILRKLVVLAVGIPLLLVGIVLIPLPGPGLVICLLSLIILSLEFERAKNYRDTIINKLKDIIAQSKGKYKD